MVSTRVVSRCLALSRLIVRRYVLYLRQNQAKLGKVINMGRRPTSSSGEAYGEDTTDGWSKIPMVDTPEMGEPSHLRIEQIMTSTRDLGTLQNKSISELPSEWVSLGGHIPDWVHVHVQSRIEIVSFRIQGRYQPVSIP